MVDWESQDVVTICGFIFEQMAVFFAGLYIWEIAFTVRYVELPLLRRRMLFRPAFFPYLIGRYCVLCSILSLVVANHISYTQKLNCQVGYQFSSIAGLPAVCCASANLMIRPLVLWRKRRAVFFPLIVMSVMQFGFSIYVAVTNIKGHWDPDQQRCSVTDTDPFTIGALYLYTMVFDFVILVLTLVGLSRQWSHSTTWKRLQRQGIWYFVIVCVVNMPSTVRPFIMNVMWTIPGAFMTSPCLSISMIASCRMVTYMMAMAEQEERWSETAADPCCPWTGAHHRKATEQQQQLSTNVAFPSDLDSYDLGGAHEVAKMKDRRGAYNRHSLLASVEDPAVCKSP
ncbi:hypothetical protein B0H21DRAFT_719323 [Amylocystis lapponica]|nr:hypothetical protein B0H21DRAFT_719323 [Amylocystis lapponica]